MSNNLKNKIEVLNIENKVPVSIYLLVKASNDLTRKTILVNNKTDKSSQMTSVPYFKSLF